MSGVSEHESWITNMINDVLEAVEAAFHDRTAEEVVALMNAIGVALPPNGIVWELDVARFGFGDSVLTRRFEDGSTEPISSWQGDVAQTITQVKMKWSGCRFHERPSNILVDGSGIGTAVVDSLKAMALPGLRVNST